MLQKLAVIAVIGALTAFPGINSSRAQTEYNPRINPADSVAEEDMGSVVGLDKKVTTAARAFDNCLQTRDWTPLEKASEEHKYYCPAVGFLVLEGTKRRPRKMELVGVSDQ